MNKYLVEVDTEVTMRLEVDSEDEWDAKNLAETLARDALSHKEGVVRVTTGFSRVLSKEF